MTKVILFLLTFFLILYLGLRENSVDSTAPSPKTQHIKKNILPDNEEKAETETRTKIQVQLQQSDVPIVEPVDRKVEYQRKKKVTRSVTSGVKRSQLIGGADIVWIEPKPKDSENTFGKPPM